MRMKKYLLTALLLSLPQLAHAQTTPAAPAPATSEAAKPAAPEATKPAVTTPAADTVVASVGGKDLTFAQFNEQFKLAIARTVNAQGVPYSEEINAQFAPMRGSFLPTYARQQAIGQLAQQAGFKADTAAVDAQIKALNEQVKNPDELNKALNDTGFANIDAYRQFFSEQQPVSAYLKSLQSKFKFSDSLVNSFYTMHKDAFVQPASACAKHILVNSEAEAQQIAKDLKAGGDFAKLAQEKSKDPGSAARGGDLGCFGQGQMVPEFDKASFTGPLNEVQTVKSQFGYHLVVVTKRTATGLQPLSEVADKIRQQLSNDAAQKYLDSQLKRIPTKLYTERLGAPVDKAAESATPKK